MPYLPGRARTSVGLPRSQRVYDEDRSCLGKIRYEAWAGAEVECLRLIEKHIVEGTANECRGLGAYLCEWCSYWHVGHSRGPRDIPTFHAPGYQTSKHERWHRIMRARSDRASRLHAPLVGAVESRA